MKFHYAKPTISFNMHVSKEPQDDGYTVLPAQDGRAPERSPSEKSLTLESSSDVPKRMKSPKQVKENQVLVLSRLCPNSEYACLEVRDLRSLTT